MAENGDSGRHVSVNMPVGALGVLTILALAAAAYTFLGHGHEEGEAATTKGKSTGSMRRKLGLMALVTLIENDATRKVVVALLKAMARRA